MRVRNIMINTKELGHFLKKLRQEKHLSQEKAAAILGCNMYTISKIERGTHVPSALTFYKMANLYGFSIDSLLNKVCSSKGGDFSDV